jgi:hypothetical protein
MTHVEVRHDDKLFGEAWRFWFDDRDSSLVLDMYAKFTRATTRHKFHNVETWSRLNQRDCSIPRPPLPPLVQREAVDQFCARVVVRALPYRDDV